jgi:hypothetical protein
LTISACATRRPPGVDADDATSVAEYTTTFWTMSAASG